MNQDIQITINIPRAALGDVLALIAECEWESALPESPGRDDEGAQVALEALYDVRARAEGLAPHSDMLRHLAGPDAGAVSDLAPITGRCTTCGAAYRWGDEGPPNNCACGGSIGPADDVLPPAPFGEVPGDIPFGADPGGEIPDAEREADETAAAADTFAMWLEQRDYVSVAAVAAFNEQDSTGHWRQHLFAAGYEEWADGSWHKAKAVPNA